MPSPCITSKSTILEVFRFGCSCSPPLARFLWLGRAPGKAGSIIGANCQRKIFKTTILGFQLPRLSTGDIVRLLQYHSRCNPFTQWSLKFCSTGSWPSNRTSLPARRALLLAWLPCPCLVGLFRHPRAIPQAGEVYTLHRVAEAGCQTSTPTQSSAHPGGLPRQSLAQVKPPTVCMLWLLSSVRAASRDLTVCVEKHPWVHSELLVGRVQTLRALGQRLSSISPSASAVRSGQLGSRPPLFALERRCTQPGKGPVQPPRSSLPGAPGRGNRSMLLQCRRFKAGSEPATPATCASQSWG